MQQKRHAQSLAGLEVWLPFALIPCRLPIVRHTVILCTLAIVPKVIRHAHLGVGITDDIMLDRSGLGCRILLQPLLSRRDPRPACRIATDLFEDM